jgi:hypothetical protein
MRLVNSLRYSVSTMRRPTAFGEGAPPGDPPAMIEGAEVIAHEKVAFYPVTLDQKKPAEQPEDAP